jgi:BirA family biotin operon repressor/biotin-[acetyl-CoA-carboxylase] ligase
VLRILADGGRHSGEQLAKELGVTRAAVWKQIAKLEAWGLNVEATRGSGYILDRPIEFLDKAAIVRELTPEVLELLAKLDVEDELDSTNRALLLESTAEGTLSVCLAEYQRAGRGRRGRSWVAPVGGGLCLSAGWKFAEMPRDLSALTLATGLVIRRVIREATGLEIRLKWPNDLIWDDKKLGGVLIELKAESQGPCYVVVGIGMNVSSIPARLERAAHWPDGAVDLYTATQGALPSRNVLAANLIDALGRMLPSYGESGFLAYREEFGSADYLQGRHISVEDASQSIVGLASGVDVDGALRVNTGAAIERVIAGDISVRLVP